MSANVGIIQGKSTYEKSWENPIVGNCKNYKQYLPHIEVLKKRLKVHCYVCYLWELTSN